MNSYNWVWLSSTSAFCPLPLRLERTAIMKIFGDRLIIFSQLISPSKMTPLDIPLENNMVVIEMLQRK